MDPYYSLQDVIRCEPCDTPFPQLYCETCHIKLCKNCAGEHLLDESKVHIVVPYKRRQSNPKFNYPKCTEHSTKLGKLHCEQCDIPICVQCAFSEKHDAHDVVDILSYLKNKKKALRADLEEVGRIIYPKYQEIVSTIPVQKADVIRNSEQLLTALNKRGEEWHREIDNVIRNLKSSIEKTISEHLDVLKKQEHEVNQVISEIKQIICEMEKMLDSNDIILLSKYKSKNAKFRILPPKFIITLPKFSSERIDIEQLFRKFDSQNALYKATEDLSPGEIRP